MSYVTTCKVFSKHTTSRVYICKYAASDWHCGCAGGCALSKRLEGYMVASIQEVIKLEGKVCTKSSPSGLCRCLTINGMVELGKESTCCDNVLLARSAAS